ncbi:MAG TPA: hypothetical protein VM577_09310 [Anaerovoracaceae bacterium]|nr:hypothetical protein [Anaerovoracaceae bacterium]
MDTWKVLRSPRGFELSKFDLEHEAYEVIAAGLKDTDSVKKQIAKIAKINPSRIAVAKETEFDYKVSVVRKVTLEPIQIENIRKAIAGEDAQNELISDLARYNEEKLVEAIETKAVPAEFMDIEQKNGMIAISQYNRDTGKYEYISSATDREAAEAIKRAVAKYTEEPVIDNTQVSEVAQSQSQGGKTTLLDEGDHSKRGRYTQVEHNLSTNKLEITAPVSVHFLKLLRNELNAEIDHQTKLWVAPMPESTDKLSKALDNLKYLQREMLACEKDLIAIAEHNYQKEGKVVQVSHVWFNNQKDKPYSGEVIGSNQFFVAQYTGGANGKEYVCLHPIGKFLTRAELEADMQPDPQTGKPNLKHLNEKVPVGSKHTFKYVAKTAEKSASFEILPPWGSKKTNENAPQTPPQNQEQGRSM